MLSGSREEYLSSGFTDYMPKPIDINLFEKMVSHYLPQEKVMIKADSRSKDPEQEMVELKEVIKKKENK